MVCVGRRTAFLRAHGLSDRKCRIRSRTFISFDFGMACRPSDPPSPQLIESRNRQEIGKSLRFTGTFGARLATTSLRG